MNKCVSEPKLHTHLYHQSETFNGVTELINVLLGHSPRKANMNVVGTRMQALHLLTTISFVTNSEHEWI